MRSSFGCWVTNAMPLSQIHLVPFTKKLGCVVHPLSTICSSFCLVGPVGIGLLKHWLTFRWEEMCCSPSSPQFTPPFQLHSQNSLHAQWAVNLHVLIIDGILLGDGMNNQSPSLPGNWRGQFSWLAGWRCPPQCCFSRRGFSAVLQLGGFWHHLFSRDDFVAVSSSVYGAITHSW